MSQQQVAMTSDYCPVSRDLTVTITSTYDRSAQCTRTGTTCIHAQLQKCLHSEITSESNRRALPMTLFPFR